MTKQRLASTYSVACICILAATATGSCARRPAKTGDNGNANEQTVPASPPIAVDRQTLDEAVIEVALVDLVSGTDKDSESILREQGDGKLLFSGKCQDWVGTLDQELASAESEKWKSLGSSDRLAAKEAAAVVTSRVTSKQLFTAFRPKDARISLWEDDPASTQPADAQRSRLGPRPIHAAPPGYGDQNRLAVVVIHFPWSRHSGDATYVLRFDGTTWHVISRHFSYYV